MACWKTSPRPPAMCRQRLSLGPPICCAPWPFPTWSIKGGSSRWDGLTESSRIDCRNHRSIGAVWKNFFKPPRLFAVFWWSFDVLFQCQFSIFDQPPIRLSDAPGSPASRRIPDTSAARVPAAPARSHLPGCSLAHLRVPSAQCLVVKTQLFWITPVLRICLTQMWLPQYWRFLLAQIWLWGQ